MFSDIDYEVLKAYLVYGYSHRKIQKEILGLDAPARGGGFAVMDILHKYGIREKHKAALIGQNVPKETLIKYVEEKNLNNF